MKVLTPVPIGVTDSRPKATALHGFERTDATGGQNMDLLSGSKLLGQRSNFEATGCAGKVVKTGHDDLSWPDSVVERWHAFE